MQTDSIRGIVERIGRDVGRLSRLPATAADKLTIDGLVANWNELATLLDVGPPPLLRNCPRCGNIGMQDATLCGYCWLKLTPPPTPSVTRSEREARAAFAEPELARALNRLAEDGGR
jgi:hypothetical protein